MVSYEFVSVGDHDVHLAGLGRDDLGLDGVLAQEHLATVGLLDGDGRDRSENL